MLKIPKPLERLINLNSQNIKSGINIISAAIKFVVVAAVLLE